MREVIAFALCWPNDDRPLLFLSAELAEENRRWFTQNYKIDRNGRPRGAPYVVKLVEAYNKDGEVAQVEGCLQHKAE